MPCPVMKGSLRFMPERSGEFEVAGQARDGVEAVVVRAVRNDRLNCPALQRFRTTKPGNPSSAAPWHGSERFQFLPDGNVGA